MSTYLLSGLFLVAVLLTVRLCVFGLRVQVVVSSEKAVKLGVGRGGVSEQNRAVHASRSQEGMVAAEEINAEVDLVVCLRFGSFSIVALCFVGSSAAVVPGSRGDHVADVILSTYLLSGVFFFAMPPMMISRLMGRSVQAVALVFQTSRKEEGMADEDEVQDEIHRGLFEDDELVLAVNSGLEDEEKEEEEQE
ncbi:hypothetical protein Q7P35_006644 [Cladosporium inversicolor]